jgi:ribulose-phosphate 3-epimerase
MLIIPAINCLDFFCIKSKLTKALHFLSDDIWVQIDIADGRFTDYKTWNNSKELEQLIRGNEKFTRLKIEMHLMVEEPEKVVADWLNIGAKRIIVHLEALKYNLKFLHSFDFKQSIFSNSAIEEQSIGLAINPDTPVDNLMPFLEGVNFVQILAVSPGRSGQRFDARVLEKILYLRKNYPNVIIEVDGGISEKTALMCQNAGADILVVGSYIWNNKDPQAAYQYLNRLLN